MNAIRYDLDGDGDPESNTAAYQALFGANPCPSGNCSGYKLTADIDMSGFGNWNPIPLGYNGYFILDGQGHTIRNFTSKHWWGMAGLFKQVWTGDIVKRIHFENADVAGLQSGIVTALNVGFISQISAEGMVDCNGSCGGLVGNLSGPGQIFRSYYHGDVKALWGASAFVGGLVGSSMGGGIFFSYARGDMPTIEPGAGAGGLIGMGSETVFVVASYAAGRNDGMIGIDATAAIDSYWDSTLGASQDDHGGSPQASDVIQSVSQSTAYTGIFATWNDNEILNYAPTHIGTYDLWDFGTDLDYPTLRGYNRLWGHLRGNLSAGVPSGVVLAQRDKALHVSWDPQAGTTFDTYWRDVTTTTYTKVNDASNPHTITGLSNDKTYEVIVCYDETFPNSCSSPLTESPAQPGSPDGLRVDGVREGIKATWDPVPGAVAYGYAYGIFDETGLSTPARVNGPTVTVTGLTGGTRYFIQVWAIYKGDLTGSHSSGTGTALKANVPGPPSTPTFTSVDSTSAGQGRLHVKWQTPSETGATAISKYLVQYSLNAKCMPITDVDLSTSVTTRTPRRTSRTATNTPM